MFFSGLVHDNSSGDSLSTNLRLRWEYTTGSELFVVYTDDRDTDPLLPNRFSELRNRGFVVKLAPVSGTTTSPPRSVKAAWVRSPRFVLRE